GKSIQLTIRYKDRQTVTRSRTISSYVEGADDIYTVILELFVEHWTGRPIRLLGVTVSNLLKIESILEQLSLFTYECEIKKVKAKETMKQLEEKYSRNTYHTHNNEDMNSDDNVL